MKNLTTTQKLAVSCDAPLVTIIAGPGSGKTTTLLARVRRLIEDGAEPERIALISFTNAAANEMQDRLLQRDAQCKLGYCGTLHGFMLRLLRAEGQQIGLWSQITVMDEDQADDLLNDVASEHRCLASIKDLKSRVAKLAKMTALGQQVQSMDRADLVAAEYQKRMLETGALDYDAILYFGAAVAAKAKQPFTHLLVDEFQDSGEFDSLIYGALKITNKCFIGDPDQSIYGFRGANVENIVTLAGLTPPSALFYLEQNFRCRPAICSAANKLISHNKNRVEKQTLAASDAEATVTSLSFAKANDELEAVAEWINTKLDEAERAETAILLRSNFLVREFKAFLMARGIAVRERENAVRPNDYAKACRFIALLANPENDRMALWWISETRSKEEAGKIKLAALQAYTSVNQHFLNIPTGLPLAAVPDALVRGGFSAETVKLVTEVANAIPRSERDEPPLAELVFALNRAFESREIGSGVFVGTIHSAKGREWDRVWLPAFEQQVIPANRDLEEERRIAYVAITRARLAITFSTAAERRTSDWQKKPTPTAPSQFLMEAAATRR